MQKELIYLASPYSSDDRNIKEKRFREVSQAAAELIRRGHIIFSPVVHFHPIAIEGELPGNWSFWKQIDTTYLKCCSRMFVLMIPGWESSVGIKGEIDIAKNLEIPICYVDPNSLDILWEPPL